MAKKTQPPIGKMPQRVDFSLILKYLNHWVDEANYLEEFKRISYLTDDEISLVLDLNVKTYRSYKSEKATLSEKLKEHLVVLFALFQHGQEIFGSAGKFRNWLNEKNYFFNGNAPILNLQTISGLKFIDDRLTAIEFGDNI